MPNALGTVAIAAERGGTIGEITSFLTDLEAAYLALYRLDSIGLELRRLSRRIPIEFIFDIGYPLAPFSQRGRRGLTPDDVSPRDRLVVSRVSIESPGFWEFFGSLNPLQQIREYLNDRHKRRQDKEFREAGEKEKLGLENELIRRTIYEKENSVIKERIAILRDLGYDNDEIANLLWSGVGMPLSKLGKHQDNRLIGGGHDDKGKDAA